MASRLLSAKEIERGLRALGVPEAMASAAAVEHGDSDDPWVARRVKPRPGSIEIPEVVSNIGQLDNATLIRIETPPRTKKNHGRSFGIKQSMAYVRYRIIVEEAVKKTPCQFPLPDVPYNLAAIFFVDGPGERADLIGLHQGLADALQDAGVVTDDWYFRTMDRSRIVFGDPVPAVFATITPIAPEEWPNVGYRPHADP